MNQPEFDMSRALEERNEGMENAAAKYCIAINFAQGFAREWAKEHGSCNIDIVQQHLIPMGFNLGNGAGSVFKGKDWELIGYKKSARISSHARVISVWRLRE